MALIGKVIAASGLVIAKLNITVVEMFCQFVMKQPLLLLLIARV